MLQLLCLALLHQRPAGEFAKVMRLAAPKLAFDAPLLIQIQDPKAETPTYTLEPLRPPGQKRPKVTPPAWTLAIKPTTEEPPTMLEGTLPEIPATNKLQPSTAKAVVQATEAMDTHPFRPVVLEVSRTKSGWMVMYTATPPMPGGFTSVFVSNDLKTTKVFHGM